MRFAAVGSIDGSHAHGLPDVSQRGGRSRPDVVFVGRDGVDRLPHEPRVTIEHNWGIHVL